MSVRDNILIWGVFAVIAGSLCWLFYSTHGEFHKKCEAAGGTVDGINRGFWCIKNGVYIDVDHRG